jgi:hypothetical protein
MTMSPRARPSKSYSNELAGPSTARSFSFAPCLKPDMEPWETSTPPRAF